MQRIWVYCEQRDAAEDVLGFCKQSKRLQLIPELVKLPEKAHWHSALKALITRPPAPYGQNDWRGFWSDVDALLVASLANRGMNSGTRDCDTTTDRPEGFGRLPAMRWPSLLVTDREKMCKVMFDITVRGALAEAVSLRVSQLVPVVLAADFGSLCGLITTDTPMSICDPLTLRAPRPGDSGADRQHRQGVQRSKSQPALARSKSSWNLDVPEQLRTRAIELRLGVFIQRSLGTRLLSSSQPMDARTKFRACFGARVLALLADGRCAYSAISSDGTRSVEASGIWEVVNGHLVVGGRTGQARVAHLKYHGPHKHRLEDVAYEEPIHISLEELTSEFEAPIKLADCVPRGAERVRLTLGAKNSVSSGMGVHDDPYAAFHQQNSSPLPRSGNTSSRSDPELPRPATAEHALMSLASHCVTGEVTLPDDNPAAGPLLSGLERAITESAMDDLMKIPAVKSRPRKVESSSDAMRRLIAYVSTLPHESQEARVFASCPLKPGVYCFEAGRQDFLTYQTLNVTLHADGSARYLEMARGSVLKSTGRTATWRVEGTTLILDSRELGPSSYSFVLREERGTRTVQRQVERIVLPVSFMQTCKFTSFLQQRVPFPRHTPPAVSEMVFGLVDRDSPVMYELKCRPDRVPYHAFEQELKRRGLSCDDIISDFLFIDRDRDGQLSVADMRDLEGYGDPVASPELLDDLRLALVRRYGSLAATFANMSSESGGTVTLQQFEEFLQHSVDDSALDAPPKKDDGGELLRDWMHETTVEDRAAVFSSLNPHKGPAIEQTDFMSLNLYSAVLAVRRLEHFRSWILEQCGGGSEVFEQVFKSIDTEKKNGLNLKLFVEGCKALGYPCCEPRTMHSIFSLLDRGFGGKVSLKDFQRLQDFKCEPLLKCMDTLKRFVEDHFGGVDECYQSMIKREQLEKGLDYAPRCVSFATISKVFGQAGLGKGSQDGDPRMLFLFLSQASQERTTGNLGVNEWSLLKGFNSRALTGCPARLRRILLERYGGMDQAFQQMHTTWLSRALVGSLLQTGLADMARALCGHDVAEDQETSISETDSEAQLATWRSSGSQNGHTHFPSVGRKAGGLSGGVTAASPALSSGRSGTRLPALPALASTQRGKMGFTLPGFAKSASCTTLDVA